MAKADLTAQRLRELLSYDPETGDFVWLVQAGRCAAGTVAGCRSHGYRTIRVDGFMYGAHRLAWLHTTGAFPVGVIDHINGIKSDNRIANLRDASPTMNNLNCHQPRRHNMASPYIGVTKPRRNVRWVAKITVNGKRHLLGCYDTAELARAAYLTAKNRVGNGFSPV